MLKVFFNFSEDNCGYEGHVNAYFDVCYEKDWFSDPFVHKIVKEIDNTTVTPQGTLYNEVLGDIVPKELSSGCKSLILLYKSDLKVNGDRMGDNCVPLLLEIAEMKDVNISLSHVMDFSAGAVMECLNDNTMICTWKEFLVKIAEVDYGNKFENQNT